MGRKSAHSDCASSDLICYKRAATLTDATYYSSICLEARILLDGSNVADIFYYTNEMMHRGVSGSTWCLLFKEDVG